MALIQCPNIQPEAGKTRKLCYWLFKEVASLSDVLSNTMQAQEKAWLHYGSLGLYAGFQIPFKVQILYTLKSSQGTKWEQCKISTVIAK